MYKRKKCSMSGCSVIFTPTSGSQKYCKGCSIVAKKNRERLQWRHKERKRNNYKEQIKKCKICGVEFKTYYTSKLYCGSEECETERIRLKNEKIHLTRSHSYLIKKGRRYYKENRKKCCLAKAVKYREDRPEAKPYTPGRVYKYTTKYISDYVEERGYKLLSDTYINSKELIVLLCPEGHEWATTFHNFRDNEETIGCRCMTCYIHNNYVSRFEQSVRNFVETIYYDKIIYNDRTLIKNPITNKFLELDLYFPYLNKAIECDGLYWHSTKDSICRDMIKDSICNDVGITLLRINDKDWYNRDVKPEVINFLSNKCK